MKVVVTGGRDYQQKSIIRRILSLYPITHLAHGGAKGADSLASEYAFSLNIPVREYPADWKTYGPSAGPRRNREMLDHFKPELVIAFPGGRGTANCVMEAKKRGIRVIEVTEQ